MIGSLSVTDRLLSETVTGFPFVWLSSLLWVCTAASTADSRFSSARIRASKCSEWRAALSLTPCCNDRAVCVHCSFVCAMLLSVPVCVCLRFSSVFSLENCLGLMKWSPRGAVSVPSAAEESTAGLKLQKQPRMQPTAVCVSPPAASNVQSNRKGYTGAVVQQ